MAAPKGVDGMGWFKHLVPGEQSFFNTKAGKIVGGLLSGQYRSIPIQIALTGKST